MENLQTSLKIIMIKARRTTTTTTRKEPKIATVLINKNKNQCQTEIN